MCTPLIDKVGRHSCSVVFWRLLGWISMEIWKIRKKVTVEVKRVYLTKFPQTLALQVGKKIKCSNTQKSEHSRFKNKSLNTPCSKTKVSTLQVQALTPSLFDLRPELSDHSRHLHSQPTPALGHQAEPGDPSLNYLTTFQILKNTSGLSYSPWLLDHQVFYIASPPGAPHRKHVYRWSSLNSYSKLKMLTILYFEHLGGLLGVEESWNWW